MELADKVRKEIMRDTYIGEALKYAELLSEKLGRLEPLVDSDRIDNLEKCVRLLSQVRWSLTDSFKTDGTPL